MSKFEIVRKDQGDVTVLQLSGYLDAHTAPEFEATLQQLMEEKRYRIVASLEQLQYISSAGLGVFMGFIEEVRENQGDIKIAGASPRVFKVFDLLGFPNLYQFFERREEAVQAFQQSQD
ncbi:MAG: anti-sigma factor antagonist [Calditrichaeota bacterium]|nr:MAG: anti-sigma factor antagonist [Calditrichota bacterium]